MTLKEKTTMLVENFTYQYLH